MRKGGRVKLGMTQMMIIFLFSAIFVIVICIKVFNSWSSSTKNIYDNNVMIAEQGDSYSYKNKEEESSNTKFDLEYNKFSGDDTIWSLKVKKESTLELNYDLTIKSGDFKLVLITPDKKVENILQEESKGKKEIQLNEGIYRIKIVGKNTKGHIKLSIAENKNIEVSCTQ